MENKRFEVRDVSQDTIEKLNKIRKMLNLTQAETLQEIIYYYYENEKDNLIKNFLD